MDCCRLPGVSKVKETFVISVPFRTHFYSTKPAFFSLDYGKSISLTWINYNRICDWFKKFYLNNISYAIHFNSLNLSYGGLRCEICNHSEKCGWHKHINTNLPGDAHSCCYNPPWIQRHVTYSNASPRAQVSMESLLPWGEKIKRLRWQKCQGPHPLQRRRPWPKPHTSGLSNAVTVMQSTEFVVQKRSEVHIGDHSLEIGEQRSKTPVMAKDFSFHSKRILSSLSELNEVLAEFKPNYEKFATVPYWRRPARISPNYWTRKRYQAVCKDFGERARSVLQTIETKKKLSATKWSTRISNFLTKLYTVLKLSCGLIGSVSEVYHLFYLINDRMQPFLR